jgi:DNA-binding response OmpR family regulator
MSITPPPTHPTPRRLLIADDDPGMAEVLGATVRVLWPDATITVAPDGAAALRHFAATSPDLVLLDVAMPAPDGFAVCRQIRQADPRVPILILTGRDGALDEVRGLEAGADRYLAKPCDLPRLLAHLRALTRRAGGATRPRENAPRADVTVGDLTIDLAARAVRRGGRPIAFSPTEWVLLEALARQAGEIVPHRTLLAHVWGGQGDHNDLKAYINRLRDKLGDSSRNPRYIETRRNRGYRLAAR